MKTSPPIGPLSTMETFLLLPPKMPTASARGLAEKEMLFMMEMPLLLPLEIETPPVPEIVLLLTATFLISLSLKTETPYWFSAAIVMLVTVREVTGLAGATNIPKLGALAMVKPLKAAAGART